MPLTQDDTLQRLRRLEDEVSNIRQHVDDPATVADTARRADVERRLRRLETLMDLRRTRS